MNIRIEPLTGALIPEYLRFFDTIGFTDNPDWSACYCTFYHQKGGVEAWSRTTKEGNRAAAIDLIKKGELRGFLAFEADTPAGFCNVNLKTAFSFDKNRQEVCGNADGETVSIVCFIIAPDKRRKGIGSRLLDAAIAHHRDGGIRRFEAYPARNASGDASNYHGPLSLYLSHGFSIVRECEDYTVVARTED